MWNLMKFKTLTYLQHFACSIQNSFVERTIHTCPILPLIFSNTTIWNQSMTGNTSTTSHLTEAFISLMVFQVLVFVLIDAKNCKMNIQHSKFKLTCLILTKAAPYLKVSVDHHGCPLRKKAYEHAAVNITTINYYIWISLLIVFLA